MSERRKVLARGRTQAKEKTGETQGDNLKWGLQLRIVLVINKAF